MSILTPSNRPAVVCLAWEIDCVVKQSISGDRTTTRSFSKVALNRFGIANASLGIAKYWLMKLIIQNIFINSNIEMRSIEIGCEADDDSEAWCRFRFHQVQ